MGYRQEIEYLRKNKSLKYLLQDSCLHSVECAEDLSTPGECVLDEIISVSVSHAVVGWERIREELAKSLEVTRAIL